MARTLLNTTTSGFLTEDAIQANSLDVIDLNKASEDQQSTVPSKTTFNDSAHLGDHDVMEGFSARAVGHESTTAEQNSLHFLNNSSSQANAVSSESSWSGISKAGMAGTAIEAEETVGAPPVLKSAAAMSAASTGAATVSSAAGTNAPTATAATAATAATGFPDETNTGVKAGVPMTKYTGSLHITTDNAVISNMEVTGDIIIDAKNVTLSNIKLISNTEWHVLRVMDDATGFTLRDSEIDGRGLSDNGVYGHGTFLRNNIHDVENGMTLWGPSSVQDNYIHNLRNGKADPHYDGIQVNGGRDIDFIHNTIINDHNQTAALMLENTFGGLANITVDNNRLVGGGYTVYLDGRKGGGAVVENTIKITNNQIGGGYWGDFSLYGSKPILSGNTGLGTVPQPPVPTGATSGDDILTGTAGIDSIDGLAGNDTISGLAGNDTLKGGAGNDILDGGAGADKLDGGTGTDTASYASAKTGVTVSLINPAINTGDAKGDTFVSIEQLTGSSFADKLYGNGSTNVLTGGAGNDVLDGGAGADKLDGGAGTDTASYASATAGVTASLANAAINTGDAKGDTYVSIEQLTGSNYADKLYGNAGANLLSGGAGNDILDGGAGNDVLDGGAGNDVLYGGAGADDLTGGAGADTFTFKALADTTVAVSGRDTIFDFSGTGGDRIDLSAIDANTAASGNQAFTYVGTAAFTGKAGELRYVKAASDTYVYGDVNGDGKADFAIHLDDAVSLAKGYFVL